MSIFCSVSLLFAELRMDLKIVEKGVKAKPLSKKMLEIFYPNQYCSNEFIDCSVFWEVLRRYHISGEQTFLNCFDCLNIMIDELNKEGSTVFSELFRDSNISGSILNIETIFSKKK